MTRASKILLGVVIALAIAVAAGVVVLRSQWAAHRTGQELTRIIEARLDATAHIEEVSIAIFPRLAIEGHGLTLVRNGDERLPFIRVDHFHASGSLVDALRRTIDVVEVEGLQLDIARGPKPKGSGMRAARDLEINEIRVTRGLLRILPDNPEKLPLNFELDTVNFHDFSFDHAGRYEAQLTNPKPKGLIKSAGSFGPWNTYAPRSSPLSGDYEFIDARLDTIKGIGGILNSKGSFDGVLEHINVKGTTTTPDFQLNLAMQPVPLDSKFIAVVDGTNGDVYLEEVDATLGRSHILAKGSIAGEPGAKGRTIALNVSADGRFEDFLRLAVKAQKPAMRGAIGLKTALVIPPGDIDVVEKLQLKGSFQIRARSVHIRHRAGQGRRTESPRTRRARQRAGQQCHVRLRRRLCPAQRPPGPPEVSVHCRGCARRTRGKLWTPDAATRFRGLAHPRRADLEDDDGNQVAAPESRGPVVPQGRRWRCAADRRIRDGRSAFVRSRQGPHHRPLIRSAHFSPIATHAACVGAFTTSGMIEASATRSASTPRTCSRASTTASTSVIRSHAARSGEVIDRVRLLANERLQIALAT